MKYVSGSLYISQNFTKCSSKPFTYTIHGDKFSEQYLLQILQNNIIVIKHPWQRNNFLDIQAQNFINKPRALLQAKFMELYIHPNIFFLHLSELSTAIQDNYPQKTVKSKKKNRLKFSKKQKKKKPNTGYKDS